MDPYYLCEIAYLCWVRSLLPTDKIEDLTYDVACKFYTAIYNWAEDNKRVSFLQSIYDTIDDREVMEQITNDFIISQQ